MQANEKLGNYSDSILDLVSKNVRNFRRVKKMTQNELATKIGMKSGAYLGRAEMRKEGQHFNIKHIAKIAKILNRNIEDFFREHSCYS